MRAAMGLEAGRGRGFGLESPRWRLMADRDKAGLRLLKPSFFTINLSPPRQGPTWGGAGRQVLMAAGGVFKSRTTRWSEAVGEGCCAAQPATAFRSGRTAPPLPGSTVAAAASRQLPRRMACCKPADSAAWELESGSVPGQLVGRDAAGPRGGATARQSEGWLATRRATHRVRAAAPRAPPSRICKWNGSGAAQWSSRGPGPVSGKRRKATPSERPSKSAPAPPRPPFVVN